ncbi:MAG: 4-hydroxy-tetrahydrodipicolinate reductase [Erysipelotrichaceae bacterium]|uniref:4-hydroxy-tetrahydrodipicolinate reductase n=1 Tax=Floccifex sp. TaxID=2815810 RepID=UPI002A75262A|nr:4-hydroxy-tetrahydrodipicolinate reductase [Floccifex sp.]MDD7281563.1 4-hydroxy-tetrahydrodipicolinate reductase [Erysipelotrichaceae bacterium]MDY2958459.1 4-hydroxy-tetrahydrodipicolinate reductase [Floccifex sp.]
MKILVIGKGKMGSLIKQTALDKGHEVIGIVDIFDADSISNKQCDVVIDFSHRDNVEWVCDYCQKTKACLVMGTTGLEQHHLDMIQALANTNPVFFSYNYSYGVAVVRKALEYITPMLKEDFDIEMVEAHHNQKADAPSGTAKMLLDAIDPNNEFKHVFSREGMTGKREKEIGVFALRGGTVAGQHTVYYFGNDESITISHNATSRQIFVNGAIKAAKFIVSQKAGLYSMDDLLG